MKCSRCGTVGTSDHRFCIQCGEALEPGEAAPAPVPVPAAPPPPTSWRSNLVVAIVWVVLMGSWVGYKSRQEKRIRDFETALGNGRAQMSGREYAKAVEFFDEALALKADHADALLEKARALREMEDWPRAIGAYERAAAAHPLDAAPHRGLGVLYRKMGMPEKAADAYLEAAKRKPDEDEIQIGLGYSLYESKSWKAAAGVFRPLMKRVPSDTYVRYLFANCLVELGKEDEAREQALELESLGASDRASRILSRLRKK